MSVRGVGRRTTKQARLEPLRMILVTGLAGLAGGMLWSVHMEIFSLATRMKFCTCRSQRARKYKLMIFFPKILKTRLSSLIQHQEITFAIKRSWKKAAMMLTPLSFDKNACVFELFSSTLPDWPVLCENFQPCYRDLGYLASPPSHMNASKFLQRK